MMLLRPAIANFLRGYFSTHDRSGKTAAAYACDLRQLGEFAGAEAGLEFLTPGNIELWMAHLREGGYSPASIRRKMATVRVFCNYWVRRGEMAESPFWRMRLSYGRVEQLPRTLTAGEMAALLAAARRGAGAWWGRNGAAVAAGERELLALRNLALVELMFATGMRVGEVAGLSLPDYQAEEDALRVRGKGRRYRMAFLVDGEAIQALREHLAARRRIPAETDALFLNAFGGRLSTQGIANALRKLADEAGIERRVTPHMLRHTVATLLLRNGVDLRVVQEFLGHASITTTQRYTHISKEHLVAALREAHPSLGFRGR